MAWQFVSTYIEDVRTALKERGKQPAPYLKELVILTVVMVTAYIIAALLLVPADRPPQWHFQDERGAVTVLSALFLAVGGGLAFASALIVWESKPRHRFFWLMMAVGFSFLSLDELLEFHQRVGWKLDPIDPFGWMAAGYIRGWNDLTVILYGVLCVPAGVIFLPTIVSYPRLFEVMCVAFLFYVIHTAIDSLMEPPTTLSYILEESAKLYCGGFIVLAMLLGVLTCARQLRSPPAP